METAFPAIVTSVADYADSGTVDVRPCIRKVESNGVPDLTNAEIPGVPLMRQGTEAALVELEPQVGDRVLLVFSSRDITGWATADTDDDTPECSGGNTLTDCVALQLGRAGNASGSAAATIGVAADGSVTVANGSGSIVLAADGTVTINGHLVVSP